MKYTLENDGYETAVAYDGEQALEVFQKEDIDLILLDVMLPKMDGIEVCQRIREKSNVPIIMLTAKGEDIDKILGLEYGADDYMTKPFNIVEVKMRIKNILRRTQQFAPAGNNIYRSGDLEVNVRNRSVMLSGRSPPYGEEFDLVLMFIANPGAFTRVKKYWIPFGKTIIRRRANG